MITIIYGYYQKMFYQCSTTLFYPNQKSYATTIIKARF